MTTYSQYTETGIPWMSTIPSTWDILRGKNVFINNKILNRNHQSSNVLSLTLRGVINNSADSPIGLSPKDYATYQLFYKDDLVFKLIDLENFRTSRVGLVHEDGIMSSAYIRLTLWGDAHNIRYLYFVYYDLYLRGVYNNLGAGVRSTLSSWDLLNLSLPLPPREEQDQIVRYLDWKLSQINQLINAKRRQIALLEEQRQATIENTLNTITSSAVLLRYLGTLQNGISEAGDFFTAGTPFVNYGDVYKNDVLPSVVSGTAKSNIKQQKTYSVEQGDIFFTRTSETIDEVGLSSVCEETIPQAVFSGFLIRFRPKKGVLHTQYARYFFRSKSVRDHFTQEMNLVTRVSLGQTLLKNLPVPLPDIDEQETIAVQLDTQCSRIDKLKATLNDQISLFTEYRIRLISDVVTGKLDVRGVSVPEYKSIEEMADDFEISEDDATETEADS